MLLRSQNISGKVDERESHGMTVILLWGEGGEDKVSDIKQASSARPFSNKSVNMKTLEWLKSNEFEACRSRK
jgi:hypothetical protein